MYKLTPGLLELITNKHPRLDQYNSNEGVYESLVAQTRVKSFLNRTTGDRPHATWKWKQLLKKMVIPGERKVGETRDTDDTDSMSDTDSLGDTESPGAASPASTRKALDGSSSFGMSPLPSPVRIRSRTAPPSHTHTRSYGKTKKAEVSE